MAKKIRRIDVACHVYFVADIDESLLQRGSGFVQHVMETEALRLLKEGKQHKDFYLQVAQMCDIPLRTKDDTQSSTPESGVRV